MTAEELAQYDAAHAAFKAEKVAAALARKTKARDLLKTARTIIIDCSYGPLMKERELRSLR